MLYVFLVFAVTHTALFPTDVQCLVFALLRISAICSSHHQEATL